MNIPASEWNRMVDYYFEHRLAGVLDLGGSKWRHPWFTSVAWNVDRERFEAVTKPGLVNGRDVLARVESPDDPDLRVDLPLTDTPRIALSSLRSITTAVPEYFVRLGVRSVEPLTADALEEGVQVDITEERLAASADADIAASILPERQLKACDLVLYQQRPRSVAQWEITPAEIGQQAQFSVGVVGTLARHAYVRSVPEHVPPAVRDAMATLTGEVEDTGLDSVKLCTIYLLSPPGAGPFEEIDSKWEPHLQHELFWNASYRYTQPVVTGSQNLTLNLAGLGNVAGAQLTVNQLLATQNDAFAASRQFLAAREINGKFSTPGNREVKWDQASRLDPPFPYKGL